MDNVYKDPDYADTLQDLKRRLLKLREKVGDTDDEYPEVLQAIKKHWNG